MKLIHLIACALLFSSPLSASAATDEAIVNEPNIKLTYPVVRMHNESAKEKINATIMSEILPLQQDVKNGKYVFASTSYQITYEDNQVLSVAIRKEYLADAKDAHGYFTHVGLVFDKKTGERLPLSYFLHILSPTEISDGLENGLLKEVYFDGSPAYYYQERNMWKIETLPEQYVLLGDGKIRLLYAPYAIGPYSAGTLGIDFDREAIQAFNQRIK